MPADLENLEKPGISLCDLGNLENQGKFFESLENIFLTWNFPFNQCEVVRDKAGFFKKILIALKMGKKGAKWAKNDVFSIFQKTLPLVLAGNGLT